MHFELEKDCYSIDIWLLVETHRLLPWMMLIFLSLILEHANL